MQGKDTIVIRDMKPGEEKTLQGMARQAFAHSPLEQMAIATPKSALVAEVDGAVAGAMFLKVFAWCEKKTGYLDVAFVVKECRGKGIGRILYPAAVERLREMGCEPVTAMVIDDNAASWKSLQNQGFGTPSLTELVRSLGFGRAVMLWLQTILCIACGTRLWMSGPVKERSSFAEFVTFLWVNLLLFLPGLIWMVSRPEQLAIKLAAYLAVLLAGVVSGAIGCLAAGSAWHFGFPRGGVLITLMVNSFGAVFPMVGRWYLKDPTQANETRRAMGIQAAIEWLGMIVLFALGAFVFKDSLFFYNCAAMAATLLVYRILPFMPFGGGRVWKWNKVVFAAFALVSAALIFIVVLG